MVTLQSVQGRTGLTDPF